MTDRIRAYRAWMWRRLGIILPGVALALAGGLWFVLRDPDPPEIRLPYAAFAGFLILLQGYLALRTRGLLRERGLLPLQVARIRRRELRPAAVVSILSMLVLTALFCVPAQHPTASIPIDPGTFVVRKSRTRIVVDVPESTAPDLAKEAGNPIQPAPTPPVPLEYDPRTPPAPAVAEAAAPAEVKSVPEIRPALVLEPAHLALEDVEPSIASPLPVPEAPKVQSPVAQGIPGVDDDGTPFRVDRDQFAIQVTPTGWWFGLRYRPLPDENDPESLPRPEGRVEGFLLLDGGDRVPGITFALDQPLGRMDLLEVSWMAVDLPRTGDSDHHLSADWHHATFAYVRRLTGYTSHATMDAAVSLGASMDIFGAVQGIPDPGGTPKFTPYAAVDLAFWQDGAIGMLVHVGQNFPTTVYGSAMGITDFSVQIRWDLSEYVSVHGGYRVLRLHYKPDDNPSSMDPLREALSGPILGVDVRF